MKGKAALALLAPSEPSKKYGSGGGKSTKTSTEVRSPTETETSTHAYTKGNVTVTGGAGSGDTHVKINGKGSEKDEPMDDEKEGGDYDKVMLSAAKDILDAEDPKALKAALYDFVCAAMAQEDSGNEE